MVKHKGNRTKKANKLGNAPRRYQQSRGVPVPRATILPDISDGLLQQYTEMFSPREMTRVQESIDFMKHNQTEPMREIFEELGLASRIDSEGGFVPRDAEETKRIIQAIQRKMLTATNRKSYLEGQVRTLQEYLRDIYPAERTPITEPARLVGAGRYQDAIDGKIRVLRAANTQTIMDYYTDYTKYNNFGGPSSAVQLIQDTRNWIMSAQSFYWKSDMFEYAVRISETAPAIYSLDLSKAPCNTGWFWLQDPWKAPYLQWDPNQNIQSGQIIALLWHIFLVENKRVLLVVPILEFPPKQNAIIPYHCMMWVEGTTLQDTVDRRKGSLREGSVGVEWDLYPLQILQGCWEVLGQRILRHSHQEVDRHTAKRAEKASFHAGGVQLVYWRKAVYAEKGPPRKIDWSCQWDVVGHTRHYKSGKVVEIPPYRKGPMDKPLKPKDIPLGVIAR